MMNKLFLLSLLFLPFLTKAQVIRVDLIVDSAAPTISESGVLSNFTTTAGTASNTQNFLFTGSNLTTNVVWTAGTGMEVSTNGTTFGTTATYTPSGGVVSGIVYVRIAAATAQGSYSGNIVGTSTGAATVNVPFTATVNSAAGPVLTVNGTYSPFTAVSGSPSAAQTVTVSGSNLTTGCNITWPTGFEGSLDGTTYAGTRSIANTGTALTGQPVTVYTRMASTATGSPSGNVGFASTGASTVNVPVSGTVSGVADDTLLVKFRDSVHNEALYTVNNTNNYTPIATGTGLTSAALKYKTGVQSPISITTGGLNDLFTNNAGFGSTNTVNLPQQAFNAGAFSTNQPLTLTFNNMPNGTWQFDFLLATNLTNQASFPETIASGASSGSIDAKNNTSQLISLQVTVTGGTVTWTLTPTGGSSFGIINYFRMRKINS